MATVLTHAVVALTLATAYSAQRVTWKFWAVSVACSILPDADVLSFWLGIPYGDFWGHRGFSHSLVFAAIVSALVVIMFSKELASPPLRKIPAFLYFFAVTASHGLLDAMTDGGLGVAFFSPFDTMRYFLPWRPIPVSPIGMAFFSDDGLEVLRSEAIHVWTLCAVVGVCLALVSRRMHCAKDKSSPSSADRESSRECA